MYLSLNSYHYLVNHPNQITRPSKGLFPWHSSKRKHIITTKWPILLFLGYNRMSEATFNAFCTFSVPESGLTFSGYCWDLPRSGWEQEREHPIQRNIRRNDTCAKVWYRLKVLQYLVFSFDGVPVCDLWHPECGTCKLWPAWSWRYISA